jgi:hypothetical protein
VASLMSPAGLPLGSSLQYALYMRLGGLQGWSGSTENRNMHNLEELLGGGGKYKSFFLYGNSSFGAHLHIFTIFMPTARYEKVM